METPSWSISTCELDTLDQAVKSSLDVSVLPNTACSRPASTDVKMALINIAFAYGQIGSGEKAKEYYQRAQEEFPDSGMAAAALTLIESAEVSRFVIGPNTRN